MRPLALALLVLSLAACESEPVVVDSSEALGDRLREQFERNVGSVEALSVAGAGVRADFRASGDSGQARLVPTFVPVDSASYEPQAAQLLTTYLPNVPGLADALRSGTFVGERRRDGRPAYVASTTDPAMTGGSADGVSRSARVFVDPVTFDVLEIEQSARVDTFAQPITRRLVYEDFREVEGVRLPYRVRQLDRGQDQQLSESDLATRRVFLGGRLALERQQAEALPPGPERDAAVARATRALENLEAGVQEVVLTVDSVRVTRADR